MVVCVQSVYTIKVKHLKKEDKQVYVSIVYHHKINYVFVQGVKMFFIVIQNVRKTIGKFIKRLALNRINNNNNNNNTIIVITTITIINQQQQQQQQQNND